jgi:RNA polymerase-binding transcription factor DksA
LTERRRQLMARWKDVLEREDELLEARPPDWEDLAAEQRDAQALDRLSNGDAQKLNEIIAALRRIDAGTYGRCQACEESIDPRRLSTLPEARLCGECASYQEDLPPSPPVRPTD